MFLEAYESGYLEGLPRKISSKLKGGMEFKENNLIC